MLGRVLYCGCTIPDTRARGQGGGGTDLVVDADQQLIAMVGVATPELLVVSGEHDVARGAEAAHEGPVRQPKHGPLLI